MSHRHSSRHRHDGRRHSDGHRAPLIHAYSSTSSDSLPEPAHSYYELVPGSMISGRRAYAVPDGYYPAYEEARPRREHRIHYDDRRWSKESSGVRNAGDTKQSALAVMAASLFGISIVAGTVLFAYYILSCYGIY